MTRKTMEKVLLAIDGIKPSQKVFRYAVQLCQRLKAELRVLQVVRPGQYGEYIKRAQKSASQARRFIEGSMTAVAFAEAGEHSTAKDIMAQARKNINQLLPESERAGVAYRLTMKSGRPSREIIQYVDAHRDVVLTIYDAAREDNRGLGVSAEDKSVPMRVRQNLSIPLVVIRT